MGISSLIIREIISIYRVDLPVNTYYNNNRPYSAICLKTAGHSTYVENGTESFSDSTHLIFIPQGATYSYTVEDTGSCIIIEFIAENGLDRIQSFEVNNGEEATTVAGSMEHA